VNRGFPSNPVCRTAAEPITSSFPSGHAAGAAAFAFVAWRSENIPAAPVAALALLVSVSRMYLGTHFLSDTVFGLAMGLGITWATYSTGAGRMTRRFFESRIRPLIKPVVRS
jgi:undecaprenyl-diphosphatase